MNILNYFILSVVASVLLIGCGGGGGGDSTPNAENPTPSTETVVISNQEASSFLARSTFGSTTQEIEKLVKTGDYEQWIESQFT